MKNSVDLAHYYNDPKCGLYSIAQNPWVKPMLKEKISFHKNPIIMLVGSHSSGKSSFINWYFGKEIQKVSVAPETQKITFITNGAKDQTLDGKSTIDFFDFLKNIPNIDKAKDILSTEYRTVANSRSKEFIFIDTPGLIKDKVHDQNHLHEILIQIAKEVDLIITFFEPYNQAFSEPLIKFIDEAHSLYHNKMHFFLTKADTIPQNEGSSKLLTSITQKIGSMIKGTTLSILPIYLPNDNEENENHIDELVALIQKVKQELHQKNCIALQNQLKPLSAAVELVLERKGKANLFFWMYTILLLFFGTFVGYLYYIDEVDQRLYIGSACAVGFWIISLLIKPSSSKMNQLKGFHKLYQEATLDLSAYFNRMMMNDKKEKTE